MINLMREFMSRIPPAPGDLRGDAFVTVVTPEFNASAYVQAKMLRHVGCNVPLQMWYYNQAPIDIRLSQIPGVSFHCINDKINPGRCQKYSHGVRTAILKVCGLRRAFLMDSDVYPVVDPTRVFDDSVPMLCWQDHTSGDKWHGEIYGLDCSTLHTTYTIQGGTVGINILDAWRVLNLADWFNEREAYYYPFGIWDQTQWRAACALFNVTPCRYSQNRVDASRSLIFVHDGPDGSPMFIHRTGNKFWKFSELKFYHDLPMEQVAHDYYKEYCNGA